MGAPILDRLALILCRPTVDLGNRYLRKPLPFFAPDNNGPRTSFRPSNFTEGKLARPYLRTDRFADIGLSSTNDK
jgi:hypothetical protein